MDRITIRDEFIRLGQAMKLADMVSSGAEAKAVISEGKVKVNGEEELRRGRKLYTGDTFSYQDRTVSVEH